MVQIAIQRFLLLLLCVICTVAAHAQWSATLTLSASVKYWPLDRREGLGFAVQNIETGAIQVSWSLTWTGLSRHDVIVGLPPGDYQIIYLGKLTGIPAVDSSVVRAFDPITIENRHHYYLGFLNGKARTDEGVLEVQMCRGRIDKVQRKLIKKDVLLQGEKLIEIQPYKRERFSLPL